MKFSEAQKNEFWTVLSAEPRPRALSAARMEKLRIAIWHDDAFWRDIIGRHGGGEMTAAEMKTADQGAFEHCLGNFHGMLVERLKVI